MIEHWRTPLRKNGGICLMRKALSILWTALVTTAGLMAVPQAAQAAESAAPPTIPALTNWTATGGTLTLSADARIVVDNTTAGEWTVGPTQAGITQQTLNQVAAGFATDLAAVTGLSLPITHDAARPGDITLGLSADSGAGPEGYRLVVDTSLHITAGTSAGAFYGGRSILQILRQDPTHTTVPTGSTTDSPAKPIRGVLLDMGRKYWQPGYIEDLIREMAWVKANVLVMHFAEAEGFRLNSPDYPGLADPASSYTQAQMQQFHQLAAANNVTIMPGFEFPGHAAVVADYFRIGFGDGPNADGSGATAANSCGQDYTHGWVTPAFTMNLTNPRTLQVSQQLLATFMPWFTGPYVHIGGDEVPGGLADCPAVQSYLTANAATYSTLGDLLAGHINSLDTQINAAGKQTVVFSGFEETDHPKQTVDTDVIVMDWQHETGTSPTLAAYRTIQAAAPGSGLYLTPNNYHRSYPNQPWLHEEWQPSTGASMLGGMMSVWADYNMWAEDRFFEDLAATPRALMAAKLWNTALPTESLDGFQSRLSRIGKAPGHVGFPAQTHSTDGKPIHLYPMDPAAYPAGWHDAAPSPHVRAVRDTAGTLHGSTYIIDNPLFANDGARGSVLRFAGSGDGVGLGGSDIAEPWTYSVWVRRTGNQPDATLLASKTGAIKLEQYDTEALVGFTRSGTADYSFPYSVPMDQWVQLTFVTTPGTTTLYANGAQVGQVDASIPLPMHTIGQGNGTTLKGDLDNMAVYSQALTQAQVTAQYLPPVVPGGDPLSGTQIITTTVENTGALTMTVDGAAVTLPSPELTPAGDRLATSGALNTVQVTDLRSADPGWNVNGQVTDFAAAEGGASFDGSALGWTPTVVKAGDGQQVTAGQPVAPATDGGVKTARLLGQAVAGHGRGTAVLGADLSLSLATTTAPGTYRATLTVTAI
ncbi:family 20 glycosylhydrolase [Kitasatospora sp. NPDC059327]|uniref:family 20 glycosylhydrolase n=1 Tax=Kitasatospora sp. NPDC059327 TaxID=3346803 RepID=UPI0036B2C8F8